jgi:hypothetical protein
LRFRNIDGGSCLKNPRTLYVVGDARDAVVGHNNSNHGEGRQPVCAITQDNDYSFAIYSAERHAPGDDGTFILDEIGESASRPADRS